MVPLPTQSGSPTTGAIPTEVDRPRDSPFESFSILWPPHTFRRRPTSPVSTSSPRPESRPDHRGHDSWIGPSAVWRPLLHARRATSHAHRLSTRGHTRLEDAAVEEAVRLFLRKGCSGPQAPDSRRPQHLSRTSAEHVFVCTSGTGLPDSRATAQRLRRAPASSRGLRTFSTYPSPSTYGRTPFSVVSRRTLAARSCTLQRFGPRSRMWGSTVTVRRYADEANFQPPWSNVGRFRRRRTDPRRTIKLDTRDDEPRPHRRPGYQAPSLRCIPSAFATLPCFLHGASPRRCHDRCASIARYRIYPLLPRVHGTVEDSPACV